MGEPQSGGPDRSEALPAAGARREEDVRARRRLAFLVSSVVLIVTLLSLRLGHQLGDVWEPDEWLPLGANLAIHGTLGEGREPTVFRPPGYPAFIALVFRALGRMPARVSDAYIARCRPALYITQAVVLALAVGGTLLALAPRTGTWIAVATALAFGLNPYSLALVGFTHYGLLHMSLLVPGGWALAAASRTERPAPLVAAGALWGVLTLLRPTSLLLPVLFPLLFLACGRGARRALRASVWLITGLALVVAPWSARNAAVRQRFILVNAQGWTAVWAATYRPLPPRPDHFNWYSVADGYYRIFRRVTEAPAFTAAALYSHDIELEDAFRGAALEQLRQRPQVYARNVLYSLEALLLHTSVFLVKAHEHIQRRGVELDLRVVFPGQPQHFERSRIATSFRVLTGLLLPVAALGIVAAWRRRDSFFLAQLTVFASVVAAHAVTHMDLHYYYVRLPFLFVFAARGFSALDRLPGAGSRSPGTILAVAFGVAFAALGTGVVAVERWPWLADWL